MIAAIANPIMCVGFFSGVFVSVVFASPLFLYVGVFTNPAIFVTKAHAKLVTAIGSPVFATVAFANLVCLAAAFGRPYYVTPGSRREAGIKSCLHQASGAFVTAANANRP